MAHGPPERGGLTLSGLALAAALLTTASSGAAPAEAAALPRAGAGRTDGPPRADTVVLEDDLGRTVRLDGPARRIVSLVPAATEILFALGAGERVVGRTRYGTHPPEAAEVPSVGPGMRPSLEMVTSREPDAVVLYAGAGNRTTVDRLESLGVATLALRHDGFADLYRNLRRLGRVTGREEAARELEADIRCRLEAVASATRGAPRRRVYYEVWSDPPITVGSGSYLDSLLSVAGARNVFRELEAPSPQVGLESVVARDPDLVLVPRRSGEEAPTPPSRRPGWDALEAVREGRVREVDGDLVHRLGPRVGEAAAVLARAIHPGLAARLTADELETACGAAAGVPGDGTPAPGAEGAVGAGGRAGVVPRRRPA